MLHFLCLSNVFQTICIHCLPKRNVFFKRFPYTIPVTCRENIRSLWHYLEGVVCQHHLIFAVACQNDDFLSNLTQHHNLNLLFSEFVVLPWGLVGEL